MKKMNKIRKEPNELIVALKVAAACAVEFTAIIIAIPAKIMLGISGLMAKMALKLAGGRGEVVQTVGMTDEEIITEIADV